MFVARGGDPTAPRAFENAGIRVAAASADHLLAMKALAARRRDVEDLRLLVHHLGLTSVDEWWRCVRRSSPMKPSRTGPG